jgi:Flp pilus assembly protein TadG
MSFPSLCATKDMKRQRGRDRGQSLLEFAMVLPILLLLAIGTIEFGRAYYHYNTLSKAVRQAARYMSTHAYTTAEQTNACRMAVYGNATGTGTPVLPGLTTSNFVVTPRNGGTTMTSPPEWVKVSVTGYTFQSMFPNIVPINASLTAGVEMRYVGANAPY